MSYLRQVISTFGLKTLMMKMTMRIKSTIYIVILFCLMIFQSLRANAEPGQMIIRHKRVINATVRIEVAGKPKGTGFVVDSNLIVTNYHVVQDIRSNAQGGISANIAQNITVRLSDGTVLSAIPL